MQKLLSRPRATGSSCLNLMVSSLAEAYDAVIKWVHWTCGDSEEVQPDLDPTLTDDEKNELPAWFAKREEAMTARQRAERPDLPPMGPRNYQTYQCYRGRRGGGPPSEDEDEASDD